MDIRQSKKHLEFGVTSMEGIDAPGQHRLGAASDTPNGVSTSEKHCAEGYLIFYLRPFELLYCFPKSLVKISTTNILCHCFDSNQRS